MHRKIIRHTRLHVGAPHLLFACFIGLGLTACKRTTPTEVERRASEVLQAVQNRDAAALTQLLAGPNAEAAQLACSSPIILRSFAVRPVSAPSKQMPGLWRLAYEATISDYPSAIFNCMVNPALLNEPHRLKPFEDTVTLSGTLILKQEKGKWLLLEPPPPHEPLGLAIRFQRASAQLDKDKAALGLCALFPLMNDTEDPNHLGPATRENVLAALSAKMVRAEGQGISSLLQARYLPENPKGIGDQLAALGTLDGFLLAWWRGTPESAVHALAGENSLLVDLTLPMLRQSPVRLRSYQIKEIRPVGGQQLLVSVGMNLSDPCSAQAAVIAAGDVEDVRSQLSLVDEGIKITEPILMRNLDGKWLLELSVNKGVVGYLLRFGKLMSLFERKPLPPISDKEEFIADLALRLSILGPMLEELDFGPIRSAAIGSAASDSEREAALKSVLEKIVQLTSQSAELKALSAQEAAFVFGIFISMVHLQPLFEMQADKSLLRRTDLFNETKRLGRRLEIEPDQLLGLERMFTKAIRKAELVDLLGNPDEVSEISLDLARRHDAKTAATFNAGLELGRAIILNDPKDSMKGLQSLVSICLLKAGVALALAEADAPALEVLLERAKSEVRLSEQEETRWIRYSHWFKSTGERDAATPD